MAEYLSEEDMNTGEYISRDLALRQLNATCLATDCDNYNGVRCRACAYADAMDFIDAIPSADVQPVKHGRWLPSDSCITAAYGTIHCQICSECGADLMEDSDYDYDFCPVCGARMDGDAK